MFGLVTNRLDIVNEVILRESHEAIKFTIGLAGIMAFWMGIMNIAKESGLMRYLGRVLSPIIRILFPEIPKGHPAISSITMNIIANMFGAGNSATAFGIKAMEDMNTLNRYKDRATNAMCMFLIINMSSVQLLPLTVLKIRAQEGASNPTDIIGTSLIATSISTIVAIIITKIVQIKERI